MSIVNLNDPFDISQITITSGTYEINGAKVESYFSVLLREKSLYIQSPQGVCLSPIGDNISVEFNSDKCKTIVDWTRDVQNRCYYLASSYTKVPRQYKNTILDHNTSNETAVLVATVGKQDNQVHELIVYDETKTLRSELDVVKNSIAVFIFEIKGFFILDGKLQWHIVARQIMLMVPNQSPSQSPTKPPELEPELLISKVESKYQQEHDPEPELLIPELEYEFESKSKPELEQLSSLQTLDIYDPDQTTVKDALDLEPMEPIFLQNDIKNIVEEPISTSQSTKSSGLLLIPKRHVYINMYKQSKKNADFLKQQYDNALQTLDAIKNTYAISDADCYTDDFKI